MKLRAITVGVFLGALFYASAGSATPSCLPQRRADLVRLIGEQPILTQRGGAKMVTVTRGSPRWMAAFNAALAWQNADCPAFAAFAEKMGYEAFEVVDVASNTRHWVLLESDTQHARRWNGLFVLRAPDESAAARRLIITAPHLGADFFDDRAVRLYMNSEATALLLNNAHPCNLDSCSGCGNLPGSACAAFKKDRCARASDAAHAVDNLLFALFAALEATRTHVASKEKDAPGRACPYLHFEYHGILEQPESAKLAAQPSCPASVELSQGRGPWREAPPAAADAGSDGYADRFFLALKKRLSPHCVCYDGRERGCTIREAPSVFGRLVNEESKVPFDPCTQESTRLSGRHLYFAGHNVPFAVVAESLKEAVPPSATCGN